MSEIEVRGVGQTYIIEEDRQEVLRDINLEVEKGELVCIVGPSGCGKSTLLRQITGLEKPKTGEVILANEAKTAMVFQNFALFPWLTVLENVGFGLKMLGKNPQEISKKAKEHIKETGLEGMEQKHPKELSGGMKQRVGIARALAIKPTILFLDEPFSSLDVFTADTLRADLLKIWAKDGLTVLMVSHLVEEAVYLADRIVIMSPSPGRIKKILKVGLPRPRNIRSESFYHLVDEIGKLIQGD
jgi:NitT/TauT family transport system ATP-binding protein